MSWMSQNYHIASLAGGVLVLGGLGYMAKSNADEIERNFAAIGGKKKDTTTVVGVPEVGVTTESLSGLNTLKPPVTPESREVDLFTSVDLFIKDGDASKVIDLLQEPDVHPGIPNKWWVKNRVDPSWSDAPMEDKDGDGFFNGEEYEAGTDPSDPNSIGGVITKLEVDSMKSDLWFLDFSGVIGQGTQFKFSFKPAEGDMAENRIPATRELKIGEFFYPEEPGLRRFKLLKVEKRDEEGRFGPTKRDYAHVEDQLPNKEGELYVIPYRVQDKERLDHYHFDHTVTFRLNAIGKSADTFDIKENGTFEIPQGDSKILCKLVAVKVNKESLRQAKVEVVSVTVEYGPEGDKKTIEITVN